MPATTARLTISHRVKLMMMLLSRWAIPYRIHGNVTTNISAQVANDTP